VQHRAEHGEPECHDRERPVGPPSSWARSSGAHHRPSHRGDDGCGPGGSRRPPVDCSGGVVGCVEPVDRREHEGDGRHDEGGRHEPRPAGRAGQHHGQRGEPSSSRREREVHQPAVGAQRIVTQSALDRRDPWSDDVEGDHAGHRGAEQRQAQVADRAHRPSMTSRLTADKGRRANRCIPTRASRLRTPTQERPSSRDCNPSSTRSSPYSKSSFAAFSGSVPS
jgi:hypothetical protein